MIVPFGFSVGDFIAAIELARGICSSLRGHGGAIDVFHEILAELEVDCDVIQQLQLTSLPPEFAKEEAIIAKQANALHHSALELLKWIKEYETAFSRHGAAKFYHAVGKKTKWSLMMTAKIDLYRTKIQAHSLSLRLLVGRVNLTFNTKLSEDHAQLMRKGDQMLLQHETILRHINNLESSIPSITNIERAIRSEIACLQVPTSTLSPWSPSRHANGLQNLGVPATLSSTSIAPSTALRSEIPSSRLLAGSRRLWPLNDTYLATHPPRKLLLTADRFQQPWNLRTDDPILINGVSLPNLPFAHGSTVFFERQRQAVNQIVAGVLSLIRNLGLLYPQFLLLLYLLHVKLQCIPRSLSLLLSDNITLTDFLGREHSLQYCYFKEWPVVFAMLQATFANCKGIDYITSSRFDLEHHLSRNKSDDVGEAFERSFSLLGRCPNCAQRASLTLRNEWSCEPCRILFKPREPGDSTSSLQSISRALRTSTAWLEVNESPACTDRRLDSYIERLAVARWQLNATSETLGKPGNNRGSADQSRNVNRSQFVTGSGDAKWIYTKATEKQAPVKKQELDEPKTMSELEREMADLRSFKRVSLPKPARSTLYDAALLGNAALVQHLIEQGEDVYMHRGPLGFAIDAAVLSGSADTVFVLLQRGADPMAPTGILGSPIRAAAIKEHLAVLYCLLDSLDEGLPQDRLYKYLKDALDDATIGATAAGRRQAIEVLLFRGANPFCRFRPLDQVARLFDISAFRIAFVKGADDLLHLFVSSAISTGGIAVSYGQSILQALLNTERSQRKVTASFLRMENKLRRVYVRTPNVGKRLLMERPWPGINIYKWSGGERRQNRSRPNRAPRL